jgi:hypothetical protein
VSRKKKASDASGEGYREEACRRGGWRGAEKEPNFWLAVRPPRCKASCPATALLDDEVVLLGAALLDDEVVLVNSLP